MKLKRNIFLIKKRLAASGSPLTAGFTMIETFVAIVILVTALVGALSLAATGFNSADVSGDQITASFLAQDAMEFMRFSRDSATIAGQPWRSYWSDSGNANSLCVSPDGSNKCYLDSSQWINANPKSCSSGVCPAMNYDSPTDTSGNSTGGSGFYNYVNSSGGSISNSAVNTTNNKPSKFTRTIYVVSPVNGADNEAHVTVEVKWLGRNGQAASCTTPLRNCVVLQQDLYNWQ